VALCGANLNSLTPLGSVVLGLLKIPVERTSLAALCANNGILCSKRLRGSPAGMGQAFFSSRLARTRATKHEAAHEETEAVAGTAVAARARAV
jgi:hypothetical protein